MDDPFAEAGPAYLHHLLLAALSGPRSPASLGPGRVVAQILLALGAAGGDKVVARYMAPVPGEVATFAVGTANGGAAQGEPGTTAVAALVAADRRSASEAVEVVGQSGSGVRRRVIEGGPGRPLRYLWADESEYSGPPDGCAAAVRRWSQLVDRWHDEAPASAPPAPVPALAEPHPLDMGPYPVAAGRGGADRVDKVVAEAVRAALAEVTVEVDLGAVERLVGDALEAALHQVRSAETTPQGPPAPEARQGEPPVQVAPVELPSPDEIAAALAPLLARMTPPVVHTLTDARGDDARLARATLASASEALHLQLEAVTDRVRSATRTLETLADELAARERSASSHIDRAAQRFESSVERLGRRVDERLDELAARGAPAGGGEPGPAGSGQVAPAGGGEPGPAGSGQVAPAGDGEPGPAGSGQVAPAGGGEPASGRPSDMAYPPSS